MRHLSTIPLVLSTLVMIALAIGLTQSAQAQTFKVLHTFSGGQDGGNPEAGLTVDKAGNLYGTTNDYGNHGYGTVYELKLTKGNWTVSPLYEFTGGSDGGHPGPARIRIGPNGTFYGSTVLGGDNNNGVVYNLKPPATACRNVLCPWTQSVLYPFKGGSDGSQPSGDLIFDQAGNLYGTTEGGGQGNLGTVYSVTPSGFESSLQSFSGSNGATPFSGVIFDNAGNFYGTTYQGGLHNDGTVFQVVPVAGGWMENIIYSFQNGSDGAFPVGGVVFDPSSGNLYGTTYSGGTGGAGTVFELTPEGNGNWSFTTLYSFTGNQDCGPYDTLVMDGAGSFYGTTYCGGANKLGSVFELTPTSKPPWTYTSLHDFTGGNDGKNPISNVTFDANGNLYGTASAAGSQGVGVVWEIAP